MNNAPSTVTKIDETTFIITLTIPPDGSSFKAPEVGSHFIEGDEHYEVEEVESVEGDNLSFKVKAKKTAWE